MSGAGSAGQAAKELVRRFWAELDAAGPEGALDVATDAMAPGLAWHGHAPVGSLVGPTAFVDDFWRPFLHSFPDLERRTNLFFAGRSNGRVDGDIALDGRLWVTGTGLFTATFSHDHLTVPATGGPVEIRWGEFCCVEHGRITEVYFLVDMVDLIRQAGHEVLPPSRGRDGCYPPPAAGDGLLVEPQDDATSAHSLDHIRRFIFDGLNAYDESDLASMGMADFFRPDVSWYGPGGIGACLSLTEFEELHQAPWLVAFPDRMVQDLDALIAEGCYSGAPGWAGVRATHTGPYLDQPATGRTVEFNGLDWWKREDEMYVENWVFVDMIHLFGQFGVDLLARIPRSGAST